MGQANASVLSRSHYPGTSTYWHITSSFCGLITSSDLTLETFPLLTLKNHVKWLMEYPALNVFSDLILLIFWMEWIVKECDQCVFWMIHTLVSWKYFQICSECVVSLPKPERAWDACAEWSLYDTITSRGNLQWGVLHIPCAKSHLAWTLEQSFNNYIINSTCSVIYAREYRYTT